VSSNFANLPNRYIIGRRMTG